MVSPEAQSPPRFPRLDPIEHFLGVAISREYRIEDLLHEAVSHDQGETLQEGLSAGFEGWEPLRRLASLSRGNGSRSRSTASRW